jgi:hypothetical protein
MRSDQDGKVVVAALHRLPSSSAELPHRPVVGRCQQEDDDRCGDKSKMIGDTELKKKSFNTPCS